MAKQTINTGSAANDGSGDTLRQAGIKINANFTELYNILGDDVTGYTRLTDSGLDFVGTSYGNKVKIGYTENVDSTISIDFPDSAGFVLVTSATQTMTNKTMSVDSNTISGIAASSFVLSNGSGVIDGSAAQKAIPAGVVVGTTDVQTLTNKTILAPTIQNAIYHGHIKDSDGADIIHFTKTASAVNHLDISNSATGVAPSISVEGTDTNINLSLYGAGTGTVINKKISYGKATISSAGNVSNNNTYISCTASTNISINVANGTVEGEMKVITHDGTASTVTVTFDAGSNFAQGTTIALDPNDTVMLIWNNSTSEWNVIGGYGYAIS